MPSSLNQLESAEIKGINWLHVCIKVCWLCFKMLCEATKRKNAYKPQSPWSNKSAYFAMNIKLVLKEEE